MKHRTWIQLFAALMLVASMLAFGAPATQVAHAAPLSQPAANARINGTECELAAAITAANTDTATGACAAGNPGADTIELLSDVTLTSALPPIASAITIAGGGYTITHDPGAPRFRILSVGSTGDLTLNAATLTGGINGGVFDWGGGIYNAGTLTLNNSTVSSNSAGIFGDIGNASGGGIGNAGTLTLNNSTVSSNTTNGYGGGIYNLGTLTLNNSTVSGNSAGVYGGGIYNGSVGVANSSTVSGNTRPSMVAASATRVRWR